MIYIRKSTLCMKNIEQTQKKQEEENREKLFIAKALNLINHIVVLFLSGWITSKFHKRDFEY